MYKHTIAILFLLHLNISEEITKTTTTTTTTSQKTLSFDDLKLHGVEEKKWQIEPKIITERYTADPKVITERIVAEPKIIKE